MCASFIKYTGFDMIDVIDRPPIQHVFLTKHSHMWQIKEHVLLIIYKNTTGSLILSHKLNYEINITVACLQHISIC